MHAAAAAAIAVIAGAPADLESPPIPVELIEESGAPAPVVETETVVAPQPPAPPPTPQVAAIDPNRVYGESDVESKAAPAREILARYPRRERMLGQEGSVLLDVVVEPDGRVRDAAVVTSAGDGFDAAARNAVEATPFRAARRDGRSVASRVHVRVNFELE